MSDRFAKVDVTAAPSAAERARCDDMCARFNAAPYYRLLGLEASSDAPGTSRVLLRHDERLKQLYGGIHGGALMSLADAAISLALATTFEGGEANATVEITMHFLAPAGANDVEAVGALRRRGGRIAFGDCTLSAAGREIARAQGILYIGSRDKIAREP